MSASIRISRKAAKALLDAVDKSEILESMLTAHGSKVFSELRRALAPKRIKPEKRARLQKKKAKREMKKEETARIREAVMERAGGHCECGCGMTFGEGSLLRVPEMDHFFGRGKVQQSVSNCWLLAKICHHGKGKGRPSRGFWCGRFIKHCEKHGYRREAAKAQADIESGQMIRAAAARGAWRA